MGAMTSNEPGERPRSRQLAQPPSDRYRSSAGTAATDSPSALIPALIRADVVALLGAAALVLVGAVFASTFGLLFVAGAMGTVIGLLLARAAVPDTGARPAPRALVVRVAIGLALVAVGVADVGIWLYGRGEGGTLGLLDYLWTTFGPFVPGVAIVAAVTAWWGATAGPVQR
jgi:hypothetical protein